MLTFEHGLQDWTYKASDMQLQKQAYSHQGQARAATSQDTSAKMQAIMQVFQDVTHGRPACSACTCLLCCAMPCYVMLCCAVSYTHTTTWQAGSGHRRRTYSQTVLSHSWGGYGGVNLLITKVASSKYRQEVLVVPGKQVCIICVGIIGGRGRAPRI